MTSGYLLDTHAVLWLLEEDRGMSRKAWQVLRSEQPRLCVSVVSAWEIGIKHQSGRLGLDAGLRETPDFVLDRGHWRILPVSDAHVLALNALPLLHRDPFDRLPVAQAQVEGLAMIASDAAIRNHTVRTVW